MAYNASTTSRLAGRAASFILAALPLLAAADSYQALPTLTIDAQQTANLQPVATYETPISNLEFEPRVDLQSRNMAEAQGDVSIRGGIFENTGFRVGSATLMDPQTGHYFAELPIAPEMLEGPTVQTGTDNALYGFNSTVGTLSYGWSEIANGGSLTLGGGDHDLNFQRLHHAWADALGDSGDWTLGIEGELSRSESNGTIQFGDHDFNRNSGRVQLLGPYSQTDFFAGYQEKFFGWPELYAAPFGAMETENLKTRLFMVNHTQNYGDDSNWEVTGYTRRHSDHYIFNRFSPNNSFVHETEAHALGLSGRHAITSAIALNYAGQLTADEIDSTKLEESFTSRTYYKLSLLPEYRITLEADQSLTLRAGASIDDSNRDDSEFSPIFDLTWQAQHEDGTSERVTLSYAQSSQVAGYTAIGGAVPNITDPSGPQPLFASNPFLERETSQNLELGFALKRTDWSFEGAAFYRWDDNLADWVFLESRDTARVATNVDIKTFGIELISTKRFNDIEIIASYTFLHKEEDYSDAEKIASSFYGLPSGTFDGQVTSFYALNFPEHRATLGAIWRPIDLVEVRIDNEWRSQEANALRSGDDQAFFTHLGVSVYPPQVEGLELFVAVDNAWDDGFQDVPGTPGRGDQYSAGATYRW
jgi:hypothetical protein